MIDPITALAGIQSAVALIKKVSKTVDDVSSLGPVLGKYFDAKNTAVKAAQQAKSSGKKSSMATAIEIEMALEQTAKFEKELQLLFMQTGKIDVWNRIKARAREMDAEAAHETKKAYLAKSRRQRKTQELLEIVTGVVIIMVLLIGGGVALLELVSYCKINRCG